MKVVARERKERRRKGRKDRKDQTRPVWLEHIEQEEELYQLRYERGQPKPEGSVRSLYFILSGVGNP